MPRVSKALSEDLDAMGPIEQPTLRDRFAMAALTGLIATDSNPYGPERPTFEMLSQDAYKMADAMLAARQGEERD